MTVTAPETAVRARVIAALTKEFETEGFVFLDDKLNDSMGREGTIGACYPATALPRLGQEDALECTVYAQLFGFWEAIVDPKQQIDPTPVEEWGERLRRAIQADTGPGDPADAHLWFYVVNKVEYPPDPSGNITRLIATITATAQNSGLRETNG